MSEQQTLELDRMVIERIVGESGVSIVDCRCGNKIFLEEGKVDYKQKDENGKLIRR
jgi:hypothetical protein